MVGLRSRESSGHVGGCNVSLEKKLLLMLLLIGLHEY